MLLRIVLFISILSAQAFAAESGKAQLELAGLQNSSYKLKSFTKNFKGKQTESRSGRGQFCGEKIKPRFHEVEGKLTLELNAGIGFEWRNINETPTETSDGCRYPIEQVVENSRDRASLILVNGEDCGSKAPVVGSQRDTVELKGDEIVYTSESVIKDRAGRWQVNEAKEGFTCVWTAVK